MIRRVPFLAACFVQGLERKPKNATFSTVRSTEIGAHGYHGESVLIHVMEESDTARGHVTIQLRSKSFSSELNSKADEWCLKRSKAVKF